MRLEPQVPLRPAAYETLVTGGEGWSHSLALCQPQSLESPAGIRRLGEDHAAVRAQDRGNALFDLGVTSGAVCMCVRSSEPALIAALESAEGSHLLENDLLVERIVRAQPHRVLISPAGRIEVFQPIPLAGNKSPQGPHTHLLPKLIRKRRTHSANVPIPDAWQPVLTLHPRAPWPTNQAGQRTYDEVADRAFAPFLTRFGLRHHVGLRERIAATVEAGAEPRAFAWPETRELRTVARVALRRLAVTRTAHIGLWRSAHDTVIGDEDQDEEA
jgi:hypothetical protein